MRLIRELYQTDFILNIPLFLNQGQKTLNLFFCLDEVVWAHLEGLVQQEQEVAKGGLGDG